MSKSLPTAREAALKALVRVERDEAYLNLVFPSLAGGLSSQDRALALRIAQGTLQHLNTLDWALGLFLKQPLSRFTPWIRNLLRLSAYQLLYAQRIPPTPSSTKGSGWPGATATAGWPAWPTPSCGA